MPVGMPAATTSMLLTAPEAMAHGSPEGPWFRRPHVLRGLDRPTINSCRFQGCIPSAAVADSAEQPTQQCRCLCRESSRRHPLVCWSLTLYLHLCRYKAYFRWNHYCHKLKNDASCSNLPTETDACPSVTAAFLQVKWAFPMTVTMVTFKYMWDQ